MIDPRTEIDEHAHAKAYIEQLQNEIADLGKAARRLIHDWNVWQRNCEIGPGDTQEWVEENNRLKKEFEDSKTALSYLANKGGER